MERSSGAAPPRQPGASGEPGTINSPNGQLLTVRVERAGTDFSVVALTGELDLSTIPRMESPLFHELESHSAVVLDLTRVSFIDSSGIAVLIQAARAAEDGKSGHLHTVIAESSQVDRVFRLAGIDRALALYLNREDAVAAANGNQTG